MEENGCTNDFDISLEEAARLKNAFKDKNFLKLFQEYLEDVNSADSKQAYEEEIISLEKERGFEVKFIHPDPVYVMKFINSNGKIFINICRNQYVHEPTFEKKNTGTEWKIPVILSKPRQDVDKKKAKCTVLDVMFHPKAIELAQKNSRFKGIVEDTARTTIRDQFGIDLSSQTSIYPKLKYKGKAPPVVLRKSLQSKKEEYVCEPIEDYVKNLLPEAKETKHAVPRTKEPKYCVKYRDILDLKDYSLMGYTDKAAPKEIIIEVQLPQVQRANDVELDILERKLTLKSSSGVSHSYSLDLDLSYAIDANAGAAKFDKSKKVLTVILPIKERGMPKEILRGEKDGTIK